MSSDGKVGGGRIGKVTMLTERKAIPVQTPLLRGGPDRVEVDVCLDCGAVVFDVIRHDKWHQEAGDTDE